MILRNYHKEDKAQGTLSLLKVQGRWATAHAMDAESEVVSKDVAFIQGVTDSVKDNVYGCTIFQVKFFFRIFQKLTFFHTRS